LEYISRAKMGHGKILPNPSICIKFEERYISALGKTTKLFKFGLNYEWKIKEISENRTFSGMGLEKNLKKLLFIFLKGQALANFSGFFRINKGQNLGSRCFTHS